MHIDDYPTAPLRPVALVRRGRAYAVGVLAAVSCLAAGAAVTAAVGAFPPPAATVGTSTVTATVTRHGHGGTATVVRHDPGATVRATRTAPPVTRWRTRPGRTVRSTVTRTATTTATVTVTSEPTPEATP